MSRTSPVSGPELQRIKDAFYAGYWAWFGPATKQELERGCSELDKSWVEYEAGLQGPDTSGHAQTPAVGRADYRIGWWLSAALEDPAVSAEMKTDIKAWFEAHQPGLTVSGSAAECPIGMTDPGICSAGCCRRCSDWRDGWNAALGVSDTSTVCTSGDGK